MPELVNDGLFVHLKIAPKSIGTILSMPPIDYCQFPTVYLSILNSDRLQTEFNRHIKKDLSLRLAVVYRTHERIT